jgi:O-methyltransferase
VPTFGQRVKELGRRLRRRVDDRARPSDRLSALAADVTVLKRQVKDLRRTVARLEKAAEPAGPVAPRTPTPVRIGAVKTPLTPELEKVIAGVLDEHLTYLGVAGLRTLATAVADLEAAGIPGLIVETGCARGGSAIVMAAAKAATRPMRVYDVFGMIPPPGQRDGEDVHRRYEAIASGAAVGVGGDTYYGYRDDLMAEVVESFARHGVAVDQREVQLIRGLFEDTITLDEPVALAHLDGDWYESTMTCLTRIAPLLVPGGRLVIDDYDAWSGCRTAVDEYFAGRTDFRFERRGKLHIVRL